MKAFMVARRISPGDSLLQEMACHLERSEGSLRLVIVDNPGNPLRKHSRGEACPRPGVGRSPYVNRQPKQLG